MEYLDEKTASTIERRRKMEEERKQRIFNEKVRCKGVDLTGIEEQIRAKRDIKEQEEARERAIAEELQNIERQVQILAQRHEEAKKKVNEDLRVENQVLASMRRTSTPPDPMAMDVLATGPSNMLIFTGEDTFKKDRTKVQQQQIIQWNEEQARLKNQRIKAEKDADLLYDQQSRAMHLKIAELERDHQRAKNAVKAADRDYNKFLGDNRKDREIASRNDESAASHYQVQSSLFDPVLTEKGNTTSSLSPNRVIPYAYKGMSAEQRNAIRDEQEQQRKEKEELKRLQEEEEKAWAAQQAAIQRTALLREREVQRTREDMNKQLQTDHNRMAKEKTDKYNHINKNVYANQATNDFFSQFGTSSR